MVFLTAVSEREREERETDGQREREKEREEGSPKTSLFTALIFKKGAFNTDTYLHMILMLTMPENIL